MGRQTNHRLPTIISRPHKSSGFRQPDREIPTSITWTIRNTMRRRVFWRNALGITNIEDTGVASTANEGIFVTIEYYFCRKSRTDARELLRDIDDRDYKDLRKDVYEQLERIEAARMPMTDDRRFTYTVGITARELEQAGGSLYLQDIDLVIGWEENINDIEHPYSTIGQFIRLNQSMSPDKGVQQRLLVVDNSGEDKYYYINTGQRVLMCKTIRDPSLQEGFYITYQDDQSGRAETILYNREEAHKELGIYASRHEAETMGSPEDRNKQALRDLEHQLAIEKQNTLRLKSDIETKKMQDDEMKREMEREEARREQVRQNEKLQIDHDRTMAQLKMEQLENELTQLRSQREKENDYVTRESERERKEREAERKEKQDAFKAFVDVGKSVLSIVGIVLSLLTLYQKHVVKG